jgi:16S rRNA (adenine1518-N6/adenine1519-N6)-dimethyltransferase
MLRASLKGVIPNVEDVLREVDIDPTARAETLSLEEFCALARAVADRGQ